MNQLPLRESLRGEEPYGAPQIHARHLLNVNENTHPLSERVTRSILDRVEKAVAGLNRYPDRDAVELRTALAAYLGHGTDAENVWAANGSNEILQQILQAFGGPSRSMLSFQPTYSMYPLLARGTDTEYIAEPREANFTISGEYVAERIREHAPTITIICSPNNPTGTALGLETIRRAYEATDDTGGILVIDEAYAEFAQDRDQTALALLDGRPRLIVSRTMSKAFALAGARLGYLAAAPEVVAALQLVRLPYHLSAVTQAVAIAALENADELLGAVDDIRTQRDRIERELRDMGYTVYESDANFVLFGGVSDPQRIWQELLEASVLIRNVGLEGTLRVTAGTAEETTAFLDAMRTISKTTPPVNPLAPTESTP